MESTPTRPAPPPASFETPLPTARRATGHANEAQRALHRSKTNLAAALARHTSKKKGPAHVPHARDYLCT